MDTQYDIYLYTMEDPDRTEMIPHLLQDQVNLVTDIWFEKSPQNDVMTTPTGDNPFFGEMPDISTISFDEWMEREDR